MLDIPKPLPEPIGAWRFWHLAFPPPGPPPREPRTEKEKPKKRGKKLP